MEWSINNGIFEHKFDTIYDDIILSCDNTNSKICQCYDYVNCECGGGDKYDKIINFIIKQSYKEYIDEIITPTQCCILQLPNKILYDYKNIPGSGIDLIKSSM
jgi:hypothetical protein